MNSKDKIYPATFIDNMFHEWEKNQLHETEEPHKTWLKEGALRFGSFIYKKIKEGYIKE